MDTLTASRRIPMRRREETDDEDDSEWEDRDPEKEEPVRHRVLTRPPMKSLKPPRLPKKKGTHPTRPSQETSS